MLLDFSVRQELSRRFVVSLLVLIIIIMTVMLIRVLNLASAGQVSPTEIFTVMFYSLLGHLPTLLTLSLFVGISSTLSRLHSENEMVIWWGCGYGPGRWLMLILRFAWPILFTIALLALIVWPWANQQIEYLRTKYVERGDLERVVSGQFQESQDGQRVFFIDKNDRELIQATHVFVWARRNQEEWVLSAEKGQVVHDQAHAFLYLSKGQRIDLRHATTDPSVANQDRPLSVSRVSRFDVYQGYLPQIAHAQGQTPPKGQSTWVLMHTNTRDARGELIWRLELLWCAFNLVLAAPLMARLNPRSKRSLGAVWALLFFVVYYNLINLGQALVQAGTVSGKTVLLGHALVTLLLLGRTWREERYRS
jgi:lipopolysaccharide export system permease protein